MAKVVIKKQIKFQSEEVLNSLIEYCKDNPDERFWQCLRNWSGQDYVLFGNLSNRSGIKESSTVNGMKVYVKDTYHFTGRDK